MSHIDETVKQVLSPKWKKPGDVMKKIYLRKQKNSSRSITYTQSNKDQSGTAKMLMVS